MYKELIYIIILVSLNGCFAHKKAGYRDNINNYKSGINFNELTNNNISNNDFNIVKAELSIINENSREKYIAGIKYKKPGKYLVSLRNTSGIEGVRILLSEDSVKVNDRINRKYYYGSTDYLFNNYGITTKLLPLLFGDIITVNSKDKEYKCEGNEAVIVEETDDFIVKYTAACNKGKVKEILVNRITDDTVLNIKIKKFRKLEEIVIPESIEISTTGNFKIIINIQKAERQISNELELIPGRNYEGIIL